MKYIVLDSTPLGLLANPHSPREVVSCREWHAKRSAEGYHTIIPEIVDYELRRELLRAGKTRSVRRLDSILQLPVITYLPITTDAMRLAATLWAQLRSSGFPTAHPHALDVDVILSAQVLAAGYAPSDFVVATSNVDHLSKLVPAANWPSI